MAQTTFYLDRTSLASAYIDAGEEVWIVKLSEVEEPVLPSITPLPGSDPSQNCQLETIVVMSISIFPNVFVFYCK